MLEEYLQVSVHCTYVTVLSNIFGFDAHAKDIMSGNALRVLLFLPFMLGTVVCVLLVEYAYRPAIQTPIDCISGP